MNLHENNTEEVLQRNMKKSSNNLENNILFEGDEMNIRERMKIYEDL